MWTYPIVRVMGIYPLAPRACVKEEKRNEAERTCGAGLMILD